MYATANLQNRYKQDHVTTATPVDLVIMLYDGCVKQLKLAKIHKENKDLAKVSECIEKAEEIVLELVRSLNTEIPMSQDLLALYEFMLDEMVHASIMKDTDRLDPVIEMMSNLGGAWKEVKKTTENMTYSME